MAKIGYVLIGVFQTDRPKVCEAPRHRGLGLEAYAVVAVDDDYNDREIVQMVCKDCWRHFDDDLAGADWNLKSEVKGDG